MVLMFVGEQDAIELIQAITGSLQPHTDLFGAESRVNEQRGAVCRDDSAIA